MAVDKTARLRSLCTTNGAVRGKMLKSKVHHTGHRQFTTLMLMKNRISDSHVHKQLQLHVGRPSNNVIFVTSAEIVQDWF